MNNKMILWKNHKIFKQIKLNKGLSLNKINKYG
jgi:hypothetical protein